MDSIKETELNLQREVVTTVPNTWLVEAVNPSTGEKKMINIGNYASVVAGQIPLKFRLQEFSLESGAEKSLDFSSVGVYYIYTSSVGYAVLFPLGAQPLSGSPFLFSHASSNAFSFDLEASGKIGVNRKQNNGNLFVKNNTGSSKSIRVFLITNI